MIKKKVIGGNKQESVQAQTLEERVSDSYDDILRETNERLVEKYGGILKYVLARVEEPKQRTFLTYLSIPKREGEKKKLKSMPTMKRIWKEEFNIDLKLRQTIEYIR